MRIIDLLPTVFGEFVNEPRPYSHDHHVGYIEGTEIFLDLRKVTGLISKNRSIDEWRLRVSNDTHGSLFDIHAGTETNERKMGAPEEKVFLSAPDNRTQAPTFELGEGLFREDFMKSETHQILRLITRVAELYQAHARIEEDIRRTA